MKITITDMNDFVNLDVDSDQLVQDVKALLQVELNLPSQKIDLQFEGCSLKDSDSLSSKGIKENDMLSFVVKREQKVVQKKGGIADMIKNFDKEVKKKINEEGYEFNQREKEHFRHSALKLYQQIKDDFQRKLAISSKHPQLGQAIEKGNIDQITDFLYKDNEKKIKEIKEKQKKFLQLSKDPMNPEYQKLLEERIHQNNIDKNYEFANEYIPETFGHINMLYINITINKVPIQALVDTGAQMTIISQSLAEKCGIMRLMDKRYNSIASGAGSCKIFGKVHAAEIQIQKKFITCSFSIVQNENLKFILGLDLMKRFSCYIDLKQNKLVFQDGLIETKFLADAQLQSKFQKPATKEELEKKLKKVMDMGFSKEESFKALQSSGFNEQIAGQMLMQKKFGK